MGLSIIIPCYNEQENITRIYDEIISTVETSGCLDGLEIIFVDDGSRDSTLSEIKKLRSLDDRVKFISFLVNYGHQKALLSGLRFATQDFALTMDCDLQHPPKYIPLFLEKQKETKTEVVIGVRANSQPGFIKNAFSSMFYPMFNVISGVKIVPNASDFRLYSRKALSAIRSVRESDPFLRAIIHKLRLPYSTLEYEADERKHGIPSYNLSKSWDLAIKALLQFSKFPYKIAMLIGFIGLLLSAYEVVVYTYLRLFTDKLASGQAELMVFLGIVNSFNLILLSLILRSNSKILDYLRQEHFYIISEKSFDEQDESSMESPRHNEYWLSRKK